jgi:hypothetical protein
VKVGDLISFKPKSFSEDDWSNPSIVLDSYISDKETIWIVWCDNGNYMVNERNDDVVYLTGS